MSIIKHELQRKYNGQNEMGSITPTCSCGWVGRAEYAYNDYQRSNVKEQESEHFAKVRKEAEEADREAADSAAAVEAGWRRGEWKPR